ncbi:MULTISPECIES: GNAT family N-acetyltransferase [Streptomyces]|uniref:GNAT family N-acetyltransferase n=2 Tax=Streptomyces rimosus subsp. rimosus TaxID=132474 RepID=L8EWM8_STRR1|nr:MULTISPECIES: GNAT family N-acetyltransferase [Streptomyces]KOG78232.1 GCN5 family acetyltransferase [Kitasatospora aureofaciens]MYT46784.1 GNAT family N-acetyltransferase [Streptomyces sp. SID5471]KOT30449.1 GCN5 family acetyltransferase [Streptomyces rimosus subsp. rimosus]KOT46051.1 GCN5 family acetyltransferase [Streptomyces sp. NRRL WC-3701]KOT52997.1 GCN5 family acetyltransferase [Streptomyces rimosus subsp. rimosus]
MDHDTMLAVFDDRMRKNAPPDAPGAYVERVGDVVRQTGPDAAWNGVLWSALDRSRVDEAIAEQVDHYTALGREFEWKLYGHDQPDDLADRLEAAGFVPEEPETLMVARIADLPTSSAPPTGIELRPVTDAAGVELMAQAQEEAFGRDGTRHRQQLLAQLTERPDTVVAVVAMAGDVPVSAARMELVPGTGFAGLWGGGTVPAWRGRGIYRALIDFRAHIAAERGYQYLQVDASDQSRPILERLGFTALTTTTPYVYRPRLAA